MTEKIDSFLVEQNIIAILLKKPKLIHDVSSKINKEYFTNEEKRKQNKCLYMIMDYISRNQDIEDIEFDSLTILSISQKFKEIDKALKRVFETKGDFIQYIESLRDAPVDPSNLDFHIEELKKLKIVSELKKGLKEFDDNLVDNYKTMDKDEIIGKVEETILKVSNDNKVHANEKYIEGNKPRLERYKNKKPNENGFVGLPTPHDTVNKFSRGLLRKGSTTVINANSGVGKSMYLKNVAKFLAIDNDIPVYLGANEQNIEEQEERIIKEITGLPALIIENNLYNSPEDEIIIEGEKYITKDCREKVLEAVKQIDEAPLYFDKVNNYNANTLVHRARYFKKRHGIECFIWDYVKESGATSLEDGNLRFWLSNIVRTMKEEIADKLEIATLTASQAKTYEFWLSAESYGIEKYCTSFCLLRELSSKERNPMDGDYAFTIKKNRYGKEHPDYKKHWISMDLDEKFLKFKEVR